jgi:hypothetical protein
VSVGAGVVGAAVGVLGLVTPIRTGDEEALFRAPQNAW